MDYKKEESCVKLNIYVDCAEKCSDSECVDINVYVKCDKDDKHKKCKYV